MKQKILTILFTVNVFCFNMLQGQNALSEDAIREGQQIRDRMIYNDLLYPGNIANWQVDLKKSYPDLYTEYQKAIIKHSLGATSLSIGFSALLMSGLSAIIKNENPNGHGIPAGLIPACTIGGSVLAVGGIIFMVKGGKQIQQAGIEYRNRLEKKLGKQPVSMLNLGITQSGEISLVYNF